MINIFAILETFKCECGKCIIPSFPFTKKHMLVDGGFCDFSFEVWECPKCGALWKQEDGYWILPSKKEIEERIGTKIEKERNHKKFIPPVKIEQIIK